MMEELTDEFDREERTMFLNSAIIGYYRNGMKNELISMITGIPEVTIEYIIKLYLQTKNEIYVKR